MTLKKGFKLPAKGKLFTALAPHAPNAGLIQIHLNGWVTIEMQPSPDVPAQELSFPPTAINSIRWDDDVVKPQS